MQASTLRLPMTGVKIHLAQALRWSKERDVAWVDILMSGVGVTGPVVFAVAMGQLPVGLAASVGALAVGGVAPGASMPAQLRALAFALVAAASPPLDLGHGGAPDATAA
jgi:hypothetical protein